MQNCKLQTCVDTRNCNSHTVLKLHTTAETPKSAPWIWNKSKNVYSMLLSCMHYSATWGNSGVSADIDIGLLSFFKVYVCPFPRAFVERSEQLHVSKSSSAVLRIMSLEFLRIHIFPQTFRLKFTGFECSTEYVRSQKGSALLLIILFSKHTCISAQPFKALEPILPIGVGCFCGGSKKKIRITKKFTDRLVHVYAHENLDQL